MPAAPLPTSPQARIDARWLLIGVLLAAAFAGLALVVSAGLPALDSALRPEFMRLQATPLWPALDLVNQVGYPAAWDAAVVAVAALIAARSRSALSLLLPMWMFIGEAAAVLVKLAVDRDRPPGVIIEDLVTDASFPSGHVTRVAVTVGVAVLLAWPALRTRTWAATAAVLAAIAAALVMGVARIASGEHWPTDVLGAYILSGAMVALAAATLPVVRERVRARRPSPRSRL